MKLAKRIKLLEQLVRDGISAEEALAEANSIKLGKKTEKKLAKAKAETITNDKAWPDSLIEAQGLSWYWGFEADENRYMVCMGESTTGFAVKADSTWSGRDDMDNYWKGTMAHASYTYRFVRFDSERALLEWMLEKAND